MIRLAIVVALVLLGAPAQTLAQGPSKGTEILWDKYGVPHIFAPDHASLFYAYGYAQMEAHSELLLRLYAQARGRGAEFYGAQYLDVDRWVRTNGIPETAKKWAAGQSPSFGPLIESFVRGLNAWAAEHKADLSPEAQRMLRSPWTTSALPARDSYDWIINPAKLQGGSRAPSRNARLERMGDRAVVLGVRQSDADEQLAPAVGRHSYLLRGPAERARRDVVRRGVGRLPGVAPVFHRDPRLDADDEQSVRVGSVSADAEGRRLRARRRRQAIRRLA